MLDSLSMWPLTIALVALIAHQQESPDAYSKRISKWRQDVEADLKTDDGWLAVNGLYWLPQGTTKFAQDAHGVFVMPFAGNTGTIGSFVRNADRVSLKTLTEGPITLNGNPASEADLRTDADGNPDKVGLGAITMTVIRRGSRIGIRVFDLNSPARKNFTGLKWFPIQAVYCLKARYVPYAKPKQMPITNVLGDTAPVNNPGYVLFTLKRKTYRLEAQDAGSGLFFNFHDLTSGKSTYGAGRFLDAPKPVNGFVTLDFNQATNPPCAFTKFATCPLPPKSNFLKVEILAGEKKYASHD